MRASGAIMPWATGDASAIEGKVIGCVLRNLRHRGQCFAEPAGSSGKQPAAEGHSVAVVLRNLMME